VKWYVAIQQFLRLPELVNPGPPWLIGRTPAIFAPPFEMSTRRPLQPRARQATFAEGNGTEGTPSFLVMLVLTGVLYIQHHKPRAAPVLVSGEFRR
jgi:hypothetical protein